MGLIDAALRGALIALLGLMVLSLASSVAAGLGADARHPRRHLLTGAAS